jgi:hypothetical protein
MSYATSLSDNRIPTAEEWERACALGREIIAAIDERELTVASRGLDRAFCLPTANWAPDAPNDYLDAYRLMRTLDWNEVRYLRFRCQIFSGFNLLHMRPSQGMKSTFAVPEDPQLDPKPAKALVAYWRSLTSEPSVEHIFRPPCALGEIGWIVPDLGGSFVNYETCFYQERVTLLTIAGVIDHLAGLGRPPRILEIGGGHGALACALTAIFPEAQYTICDLPESLLFSGLYLSLAARRNVKLAAVAEHGTIALLPNYLFGDLEVGDRHYDLAINTLSMSEMSAHQIATYGSGLRGLVGETGMFFEQNQDNRHIGLTFAQSVLGGIFPIKRRIGTGNVHVKQGVPNLWSNRAIPLLSRPKPWPRVGPTLRRVGRPLRSLGRRLCV